jgi:2',3'-cyclic-nucleotide 2'-phosphodiesterase (5'-nucleotidase family)
MNPLLDKYPGHLQVDAGGWAEPRLDRTLVGSKLLLEGLGKLGLDFANVSGRDLLVGSQTMQRLRDSAGVELLSANIKVDGEAYFATHAIVERQIQGETVRIGITGVTLKSRAAAESWQAGPLTFEDPLQSARWAAELMTPQTDLRILLAHMQVSDLETFVEEFPDAYQIIVSSNGDLRSSTPLGAMPVVVAPGTSGKQLAWLNLARTPEALEVSAGNTLNLDEKIRDDPETATFVSDYVQEMRDYLRGRKSPATSSNPSPEKAASLAESSVDD